MINQQFPKNKFNKRGVVSAILETVLAVIVVTFLVSIYFILITIFFSRAETQILEERGFYIEDSAEVVTLLKTPVAVEVAGREETITINEILTLYKSDKITAGVVKEKFKETLKDSYGSCYAFKFESNDGLKILEEKWEPASWLYELQEKTKQLLLKIKKPETTTTLVSGKLFFRNSFEYCLYQETLENCNSICGVGK